MIGIIKGKAWGTTMKIFETVNVQAHYIEIKAGGFCSKHRHPKGKTNLFHVITGKLLIRVWDEEGVKLLDSTVLTDGQISTVGPLLAHQFEALEDTRCYEIYQTIIDEDDIERFNEGGLKK